MQDAPARRGNAQRRAVIERLIVEERVLLEAPPCAAGTAELQLRLTDHPALFSAVHGVRHRRDGRWRISEQFTGPIALAAARAASARALVVAAPIAEDANRDEVSLVKDQVRDLLGRGGFLIDLHGMVSSGGRGADIVVGASGGRLDHSLLAWLTACAEDAGLRIRLDETGEYAASAPTSLVSFTLAELRRPAVALELAPDLRDPSGAPDRAAALLTFLGDVAGWPEAERRVR